MITRYDPDTLEQDIGVLQKTVRELGGRIALDCHVLRPGRIAAGDPVEVGGYCTLPGRAAWSPRIPGAARTTLDPVARSYKTEAVVLRSIRYGEADRILHLYTAHHGRIGAIAKGIRKTTSRVGGRLEPLGHVELLLHSGRGELHTVTGVELIRPHSAVRDDPYRLAVGLIGAEAMLRLFTEQEANERAFGALARYLDLLDAAPRGLRPDLDPLGLSFQLKLLWLSGYLPHVGSCAECGSEGPLAGYSPRAGGTVCAACSAGALALSADGLAGMEALLRSPLADARTAGLTERGAREVLTVITSSYEEHGGFRLRTLRAG